MFFRCRFLEYVTVNDFKILKRKVEQVQREVRQLKTTAIPIVKISEKEHKELDDIEAEMRAGKEKDWREVARSVK